MPQLSPPRVLKITLTRLEPVEVYGQEPYSNQPWKFRAYFNVVPQTHGDPRTPRPGFFNGLDVSVNDFITTQSSKILRIIEVESKTISSAVCIVEDDKRLNSSVDTNQGGESAIETGNGLLFTVLNGFPVLFPLPDDIQGLSQFDLIGIIGRFFYSNDVITGGYTGSVGYTGSSIANGYTGSSGYTGSTGLAGSNGYVGSAGYIGSTGYTGSAGSNGYVGSSGYTGSIGIRGYFGYTGSSGYTGSKGLQGLTGPKGDSGYTGSQGIPGAAVDKGYTGSSGEIGYTGSIGYSGSQGLRGFVGSSGSSGATGYTGSGGTGYTGSAGIDGYAGYTGSVGAQGARGYFGYTGSSGYVGSKGLQGLSGPKGDLGYTGSQGIPGAAAAVGYTGSASTEIGYTGSAGAGYTGSAGTDGYVGSSGYTGSKGIDGIAGYTGSVGEGYTGSQGNAGDLGYTGSTGYTGSAGVDGYAGSTGYTGSVGVGYSGSQGIIGYTGSSGTGAGKLVWTTNGSDRILTGYKEDNTTYTVRTADFYNNKLRLILATFTPTLSASPLASSSLNWDVAASGFNVTATNPTDVTDQYLSSVSSLTQTNGSISLLNTFAAGAYSATPAGGVSWTRTFTAAPSGHIRPVSGTIAGGSASATVQFNYFNGNAEVVYATSSASWSITWATPTTSASLATLSGQTFLTTYSSASYTVSVTGITNSSNYVHNVTGTGGTVSNANGNGTLTFTDPVHKNNTGTARSISNTTTFTRPASVTGTQYTAQLTATAVLPLATFTYPTVWLWTGSTSTLPTREDVIAGSGFEAGVTQVGNQVKVLSGFINNTAPTPRGFWFVVRTAASQPTTFRTGASSSLLSDVSVVSGNVVQLAPDTVPAGYVAESYTLYGITLQPGNTYVSIS